MHGSGLALPLNARGEGGWGGGGRLKGGRWIRRVHTYISSHIIRGEFVGTQGSINRRSSVFVAAHVACSSPRTLRVRRRCKDLAAHVRIYPLTANAAHQGRIHIPRPYLFIARRKGKRIHYFCEISSSIKLRSNPVLWWWRRIHHGSIDADSERVTTRRAVNSYDDGEMWVDLYHSRSHRYPRRSPWPRRP